jgi:hypothetical protein
VCKNIILSAILNGRETWSLSVKGERRLRVSENRVLRKICGPKRDAVTGGWRELHNEGLHGLYCSPDDGSVTASRNCGGWAMQFEWGR